MRLLPFARTTRPAFGRVSVPSCSGAAVPSLPTPVLDGAQQIVTALSSAAAPTAVSGRVAASGVAFWQLAVAFACGGLFMAVTIGVLTWAYTIGAPNVDRFRTSFKVVARRTVGLRGDAHMRVLACLTPAARPPDICAADVRR